MRWLAVVFLVACGGAVATVAADPPPDADAAVVPAPSATQSPPELVDAGLPVEGALEAGCDAGATSSGPIGECSPVDPPCPCGGQRWRCTSDAGPMMPEAGGCTTAGGGRTETTEGVVTFVADHCCR